MRKNELEERVKRDTTTERQYISGGQYNGNCKSEYFKNLTGYMLTWTRISSHRAAESPIKYSIMLGSDIRSQLQARDGNC